MSYDESLYSRVFGEFIYDYSRWYPNDPDIDERKVLLTPQLQVVLMYRLAHECFLLPEADKLKGDADLYALAKAYDTERSTALKVGRGEMAKPLEEAAFALEDGEVCAPVRYDGQYYIFKAVDSYDETETALRRQSLQTKRLQDIVREACRVYQKKHRISIDPVVWDQVVKQAGFPYSGENFFAAVKEALENEGL